MLPFTDADTKSAGENPLKPTDWQRLTYQEVLEA